MATKVICVAQRGQKIKPSVLDAAEFQINNVKSSEDGRALYIDTPQPAKSITFEIEGADVFAVDAGMPAPKLLLADMDSTIVTSETLDDLAAHFEIKEKVAAITERAMRGELDFHEALRERVSLLKGLPEQAIFDLLPKLEISPGAQDLISHCRENGITPYLVSGGFTHVTGYIAEKLGFEGHFANIFDIEDGHLAGTVAEPIQDKTSKLKVLNTLCGEHDISPDEVIAVGDGANDIPMLQAAGYGVAYRAKPRVIEETRLHIDNTDLSAIIYLHKY